MPEKVKGDGRNESADDPFKGAANEEKTEGDAAAAVSSQLYWLPKMVGEVPSSSGPS